MDKSATRRSPTGAQVVGHGREVLALVELGPVTLEALPDGVFDVAGQGGGGLAVALQDSTAARAWSATLPRIFTTSRRLGPGGSRWGDWISGRFQEGATAWRSSKPGCSHRRSPGETRSQAALQSLGSAGQW